MNKKNNKGFTLIEIIGIIVILAVIMIVTVPMLEVTLRNGSTKQYDNFIKNLSLVTENYIVDNNKQSSNTVCVNLETLLEENYIDEIPTYPSADPFIAGEELLTSDQVCGTKDINGVYQYQICRGGACVETDDFVETKKAYFDVNKFYNDERTYVDVKNVHFVKSVDTSGSSGDSVDLSKNGDNSVIGWIVNNDDGTYDYYIGSKGIIYAENLANTFDGMTSLVSVDFGNLSTSETTNMSSMFSNCTALTKLNLNNFDFSSVETMASIFTDASSLTEIDLRSFYKFIDEKWAGNEVTATVYVQDGMVKTVEKNMPGATVVVKTS